MSRKRTEPQKVEFYRLLVENQQAKCGISPDDVNWLFGRGRAQFLTGELT